MAVFDGNSLVAGLGIVVGVVVAGCIVYGVLRVLWGEWLRLHGHGALSAAEANFTYNYALLLARCGYLGAAFATIAVVAWNVAMVPWPMISIAAAGLWVAYVKIVVRRRMRRSEEAGGSRETNHGMGL